MMNYNDYYAKMEKDANSILFWRRRKAELALAGRYSSDLRDAELYGGPLPEWPDMKMTQEDYAEHNRKELAKWIAS